MSEAKGYYNLRPRKSQLDEKAKTSTSEKKKQRDAPSKTTQDLPKPWLDMKNKMTQLETQLREAGKTSRLCKLAQQLTAIIDESSEQTQETNKQQLLSCVPKIWCGEKKKLLDTMRKQVQDVEKVEFVSHGKHGDRFTVQIVWYSWDKHRIVYCRMENDFDDNLDAYAFIKLGDLTWGQFPEDEINVYTDKWGECNLSLDDRQRYEEILEDTISSETLTDDLPDFLIPAAAAFVSNFFH